MEDSKDFTNSTTVKRIAYNSETKILTVTFLSNGKSYEYYNVPIEVWELAIQAESIGRFIGSNIKNIYSYNLI